MNYVGCIHPDDRVRSHTRCCPPGSWSAALDLGHIPTAHRGSSSASASTASSRRTSIRSPVFGRLRAHPGPARATSSPNSATRRRGLDRRHPAARSRRASRSGAACYEARQLRAVDAGRSVSMAARTATSPARPVLAGVADPQRESRSDASAPSDDHIMLNYYGLEATSCVERRDQARARERRRRCAPSSPVQVDALTFDVRDRSRLVARGSVAICHDRRTPGPGRAMEPRRRGPVRSRCAYSATPNAPTQTDPLDEPAAAAALSIRLTVGPAAIHSPGARWRGCACDPQYPQFLGWTCQVPSLDRGAAGARAARPGVGRGVVATVPAQARPVRLAQIDGPADPRADGGARGVAPGESSPALPDAIPAWERRAAHVGHFLLYAILIVMPLSGWIVNSAANIPFRIFWRIPLPPIVAPDKAVADLAARVHLILFLGLSALLSLHIAAALRHHLVRRNGILTRMLPFGPSGS